MAQLKEAPARRTRSHGDGDPAVEAWRLLHRLVTSQRPRLMALAAELGLAPAQVMALRRLDPELPMSMRALACALGCDNSNVTGIVDRLEQSGLVERRPASGDRRVKLLVVTERGIELRGRLVSVLDAPPPALAALSEADKRALRDILRRTAEGRASRADP